MDTEPPLLSSTPYRLTRQQLLYDLYVAFEDAARHKHKMSYVVKFERELAENLNALCDDLLTHRYRALPSKCFVVKYPKKREVFAAMFRDRVVHHLYFRYTHQLFERTFIADSYSCIKGRGTLYGVNRLRQHIRQASLNWQERAYAMSLDIRGYFMHINREKLLRIATDSMKKMATHKVGLTDEVPIPSGVLLTPTTTWAEIRDMDFLLWLTEQIVMLDPMENSIIVGDESVGISLDKYLGADYPLYAKYYPEQTRVTMDREHIVPDCVSFYLLSLYPLSDFELRSQVDRDLHMGKVMWVTNHCVGHRFYNTRYVQVVDRFMKNNPGITVEALLKMTDYTQLK